jgi:hypothetical protein
VGNSASDTIGGGGIFNTATGAATVTNSTLAGNSATGQSNGGGIYNDGTLTLLSSTLSHNSARNTAAPHGAEGGAIFNNGTLILKSTLLAGQGTNGNCSGGGTSDGYNLSDDSTCSFLTQTGDQNNSSTAGLSPGSLQNNGGPTRTIALLSTSSAVNAIPPSACTDTFGNPVLTDQRGIARPQGSGCDIGAFEFVPFVSPISLNVGKVPLGQARSANVTLTNNSATAMQIDTISFVNISGNRPDFTFKRHCGTGLLTGQSCVISVRFGPSQVANETAILNIATSAPGSSLQVPLTGAGIQ